MRLYRVRSSLVLLICLALAFYIVLVSRAGAKEIIYLGTADATGVYFPTGGAICRLFNTRTGQHDTRCKVKMTGGSSDNLAALARGDIALAIIQSDVQFAEAKKAKSGFTGLRSVMSLYSEPFTVVVSPQSGITQLADLKGKRVFFGGSGSGIRKTMQSLIRSFGWRWEDFLHQEDTPLQAQIEAFCNGKIDALIHMAGHPNNALREITTQCDARLLSMQETEIKKLLEENPAYMPATIPAGMYAGNDQPVQTFGVKATLVSSDQVPLEVVYEAVKSLFLRLDDFKTLHPVFATLDAKEMARSANYAPLHRGAEKYYQEAGL
jgi:TRAP transporter TAXI family solute receptor